MRGNKIAAVLVGAIIALGIVAFVNAASGKDNTQGIARFRETPITHFSTGEYAGATETWRTRVWLLKKYIVAGTGLIACIRGDYNSNIRECEGTYVLPRGRIQVAGEVLTRGAYQLSVVGGNGIYAGVGGVLIASVGVLTFYLS